MKRRNPNTFEDALMRIAGELSAEGAGAVIHKGKGRIYAAADRDRDNFAPLNIEQCLALDVAFNNATGEGLPLLEAYERQAQALSPHRPMDAAQRVTSAVKEFSEAVQAYGNENAAVDEVEREITEAIRVLENMLMDRKAGLRLVQGAAE